METSAGGMEADLREPFPPAEMKGLDPAVAETAQPLTDMEVLVLLEGMQGVQRDADPDYKPPQIVEAVQQHLGVLVDGKPTAEICEKIRERLQGAGFKEWEMVLMANLLPGTPEEALAYIPSLQTRYTEEELKDLIRDLDRLTILR